MGKNRSVRHEGQKHIPLPTGPYTVGCTDIMTSYSKTSVFLRLFYPAVDSSTLENCSRWPAWVPHSNYLKGYSSFLGFWSPLFCKFFPIFVGDVYIPALWNAEPLRNGNGFPVVVFSHGLGACRATYSTFCVELASHGFVVAAVEHRDQSACMTYYFKDSCSISTKNQYPLKQSSTKITDDDEEEWEDITVEQQKLRSSDRDIDNHFTLTKEWIPMKTGPLDDYPLRSKQVKQRAKECSRALDLLEALNKGQDVKNVLDPLFTRWKFVKLMDISRTAIAGHSFGGATVILSLANDLRFKVGVALDPWMVPLQKDFDLFPLISQPMLSVNMEKFQTKENLKLLSNLNRSDVERKFVTLRRTVHLNQTDVPFFSDPIMRIVVGAYSHMNRFTAMDITSRLSLVFLAKHLDLPSNPDHTAYLIHHERKMKEAFKKHKKNGLKHEKNRKQTV